MTRWALIFAALSAPWVCVMACGTHNGGTASDGGTSGSSSGGGGSSSGAGGSSSGGIVPNDGGPGTVTTGQLDGAPDTALPPLQPLTNVKVVEREDSVGIDFDPVDKAVDYRVYPLPADSDITANSDGSLKIKNAVYRCAGLRQTYDLENDLNASDGGLVTVNSPFNWKAKVGSNPTLGYVYVTPGEGRIPVYAVAGYLPPAEKGGVTTENGWRESRFKIYTTDATQRQMYLSQNWRDDGIVFYVPSAAGAGTQTVYSSQTVGPSSNGAGDNYTQHLQYYFGEADKGSHAGDTTPPAAAFQVLTAADPNAQPATKPLMAVFYATDQGHTELAVGIERFNRAANQGNGPLWHVEWSGFSAPTILVVEALASGCPYQGFLSAQPLSAPPHQTFYTLDQLQSASATTEVFINGQYDNATASPVPLARSFVQVTPQPHDPKAWDFYQGFAVGTDFGPVTMVPSPASGNTMCDWTGCVSKTPFFGMTAFELDQPNNGPGVLTYGQFLGQLHDAFDDTGQDVTGRVRFSALTTTTVAADTYLHVTMTTNIVSTARRYPQMIISDQPPPIDCYSNGCNGVGTATSNSLLIQTIQGPSLRFETQAIHGLVGGGQWNVNNQAPAHELLDFDGLDMNVAGSNMGGDPPFEHAGMDEMVRFDAFISSQKLYVFMEGKPAACTTYPSGFALNGTVTVTWGDVLYHETADDSVMNPRLMSFIERHQFKETARQFDDLGYKAGVSTSDPLLGSWDEAKLPCGSY